MPRSTDTHGAHHENNKRPRLSLPVGSVTKFPTPIRKANVANKVQSAPREATQNGFLSHLASDKPSAAMFDKLFQAHSLPSKPNRAVATETKEQDLIASSIRVSSNVDTTSPGLLEPDNTTFSQFGDDIDEISLLGLAALEHGEQSGLRSPKPFFDDMGMKLESPGNFSIDKLLEDDERRPTELSNETSSLIKQSPGSTADTVECVLGDVIAAVSRTPLADCTGDATTNPSPNLNSRESTASILRTPTNRSSRVSDVANHDTVENVLRQLPYADAEYINTPARPMQDAQFLEYLSYETPRSHVPILAPASLIHQRTPPHKEPAFIDTLPTESAGIAAGSLPMMTTTTTTTTTNGESFASTTIDAGNEANSDVSEDKGSGTITSNVAITTSTPLVKGTLGSMRMHENPSLGTLGSAIRIAPTQQSSPDESAYPSNTRPAVRNPANFKLSTPTITKIDKLYAHGLSEPRPRIHRLSTPPTKKRHSMDIPLLRSGPSVELWQNPEPIVKPQSSVSPRILETSPRGTTTPPPRERLAMDVPLPRDVVAQEVWQNGSLDPRKRRLLLTPEPKRRTSSALDLMIAESPQSSESVSYDQTLGDAPIQTNLPTMPKLNFGREVVHAHSLSEPETAEMSVPALHGCESDDETMHIETTIHDDQHTRVSHSRGRRGSLSAQHFTPRFSKLRRLARQLEDDKEALEEIAGSPAAGIDMQDMTPRSFRRKQLSDDISLDFVTETEPQVDPTVTTCIESYIPEDSNVVDNIEEGIDNSPMLPADSTTTHIRNSEMNLVATPVFTLKRKRAAVESPILASTTIDAPLPGPIKAKKLMKPTTEPPRLPKAIDLAMFGVNPEVLPRSRRDRKKPAEFWKIASPKTTERTVEVTARKSASRPSTTTMNNACLAREPQPPAVIAESKKRHRVRPSEFKGPISLHRRIQASTKPTSSIDAQKKHIPSHNFAD